MSSRKAVATILFQAMHRIEQLLPLKFMLLTSGFFREIFILDYSELSQFWFIISEVQWHSFVHSRAISKGIPKAPITRISWKMIYLELPSNKINMFQGHQIPRKICHISCSKPFHNNTRLYLICYLCSPNIKKKLPWPRRLNGHNISGFLYIKHLLAQIQFH